MNNSLDICKLVADMSNNFERNDSDLKKRYIMKNINLINTIMQQTKGYCGSFGTGYPFYAMDSHFLRGLPVIDEQLRYNDELYEAIQNSTCRVWGCAQCLSNNCDYMTDLKHFCKPCPRVDDELKPREIISRIPAINMWMICEDDALVDAQNTLSYLFEENNLHSSDANPLRTIREFGEINLTLGKGKMPTTMLPINVHIIEYSKFCELVELVPSLLQQTVESGMEIAPYLPIQPVSLRKSWQYGEVHNFILDFLYSMTPIQLEGELDDKLWEVRRLISRVFTEEEFLTMFKLMASKTTKRRFETPQLQKVYAERTSSWKR